MHFAGASYEVLIGKKLQIETVEKGTGGSFPADSFLVVSKSQRAEAGPLLHS